MGLNRKRPWLGVIRRWWPLVLLNFVQNHLPAYLQGGQSLHQMLRRVSKSPKGSETKAEEKMAREVN